MLYNQLCTSEIFGEVTKNNNLQHFCCKRKILKNPTVYICWIKFWEDVINQ